MIGRKERKGHKAPSWLRMRIAMQRMKRSKMKRLALVVLVSLILLANHPGFILAQQSWQAEWDKTVAAAKKEGKVVVGLPPSAELRRELEPAFKARFGIELEIFSATGPQIANRVVTEGNAGVRYFDTFIFGSCTGVPLIRSGLFDPAESYFILPEVKEREKLVGRPCVHGQRCQ